MVFEYFTATESKELQGLKDSLFINPGDYFFSRLNNYAEFKKVGFAMLNLQWDYFNSSLALVIETFKSLAQAVYSLVILNFSIAWEQACTATKSALAAIAKLTLDLALLCLHITRLLTLLIANFFPQVAILSLGLGAFAVAHFAYLSIPILGIGGLVVSAICLGILCSNIAIYMGKYFNKPACSNKWDDLNKDLGAYQLMLDEVSEERIQIINAVYNLPKAGLTQPRLASGNGQKFFSETIKPSVEYLREKAECEEFATEFYMAINSYPRFNAARAAKEPDYVRNLHKEMEEHHLKVKLMAEECFRRVDAANYQQEESVANQTI